MTGYFTPITEPNGFQYYGTPDPAPASGWYQLNVPGATLPIVPGFTPVPDTQGVWLSVGSGTLLFKTVPNSPSIGQKMAMSLDGRGKNMLLLPGSAWVRNLCLWLDDKPLEFSIQFLRGNIGPTIQVF